MSRRAALLALALAVLLPRAGAQAERVDLELLLAVDASGSVGFDEFALQMDGIARAFRHPDLVAAVQSAGPRGIAVGMIQWSSHSFWARPVRWQRVHDRASAQRFADAVDRASRAVVIGRTAIATALDRAVAELEGNRFLGDRRVIDVSGDGRANMGELPATARDRALARGITVNGLAIRTRDPGLDRYYLQHVVGGPGAFVMSVEGYETFAAAMRRKLLREIGGASVGTAPPESRRAALP
jgi:hypothetical protein